MFNKSSQTPLIVELMDISKQNEAILKFFISGVGSKVFKIGSTSSDIEAYIIDYDFPGAQARWDENYTDTNKPRIILATNNPQADNSVWVGKPLSSKKLIEAATTIKNLLAKSPASMDPTVDQWEEEIPQQPEMKPFSLAIETKTTVPKRSIIDEKIATNLVTSELLTDPQTESFNPIDTPNGNSINNTEAALEEKIDQPPPEEKTTEEMAAQAAQQEKRWKELCGENDDTTIYNSEELRYAPENHFIGQLTGAVRLAKKSQQIVEVKALPYSIFILPNEHQIFTELSIKDESFILFSRKEIKQGEMSIHILSSIETGKLEMQMNKLPDYIHSLESFLWTSSLLASHGRLPATLNIDKKTALKYWPSFARIEAFPHSMRIAALWHHSPDTLINISRKLDIPQRYVFAFFNGADALNLVEHDIKKVKQQIKAQPKKKGSSLISRLFKRLLGGS